MHKRELIIIAGPNGIGKTTFARSFLSQKKFKFLNADEIAEELPQVCIERIKERVKKGGHHVADKDVIRRFYRSKENFWNIYKNKADQWLMLNNSQQQAKEVATGMKNTFEIKDEMAWKEFLMDIKQKPNED